LGYLTYLNEGEYLYGPYSNKADLIMAKARDGASSEKTYTDYLNGSLLASQIIIDLIRMEQKQGVITGELEGQLCLDRLQLFERLENPTEYGSIAHLRQKFSEGEVTGLLTLKERRLHGDLENEQVLPIRIEELIKTIFI